MKLDRLRRPVNPENHLFLFLTDANEVRRSELEDTVLAVSTDVTFQSIVSLLRSMWNSERCLAVAQREMHPFSLHNCYFCRAERITQVRELSHSDLRRADTSSICRGVEFENRWGQSAGKGTLVSRLSMLFVVRVRVTHLPRRAREIFTSFRERQTRLDLSLSSFSINKFTKR